MAIHGHDKIVDSLHRYLPPVSLFLGPYSVGRWAVAEHLRWYHGVDPDDVLRFHTLDIEAAQTIRQFTLTPPANSPFKLVIVELYKSSNAAQVALTTSLEGVSGANPNAKIIVIAQPNEVLIGIRSRSIVYPFRYLRSTEVTAVLEEKMGFSGHRAEDLGLRSGGSISGALTLSDADDSISLARSAIRALRTHDADALDELATKWTDEATAWLVQWCNETISGQWRVFDHEDYIASKSLPLRLLIALRPRVRPRLVVRSQLMSVLKGDA